jgi:hypothetical protein
MLLESFKKVMKTVIKVDNLDRFIWASYRTKKGISRQKKGADPPIGPAP